MRVRRQYESLRTSKEKKEKREKEKERKKKKEKEKRKKKRKIEQESYAPFFVCEKFSVAAGAEGGA